MMQWRLWGALSAGMAVLAMNGPGGLPGLAVPEGRGSGAISPNQQPLGEISKLRRELTELINQPKYAAAFWGIKIVSLDTGRTLFEHNAQKLLSPASNCKLYTVAVALDRLGADYRIKTSLYAATRPNAGGFLEGDLIVYGRGDPTINEKLQGGDTFKALEALVRALTNAGVKRIKGDLVGDDSFFRGPEFGSGWAWDDAEYSYGAEISALTINENTVKLSAMPGARAGIPAALALLSPAPYLVLSNRTVTIEKGGSRALTFYRPLEENVVYVSGQVPLTGAGQIEEVPVHNPAGLFVALFKEALARHGIEVEGIARTTHWLDRQAAPLDCSKLIELGSAESLPLSEIARQIEKPSQNLYADLLLDQVGEWARSPGDTNRTSEELGIAELEKFLQEAGIKRDEVFFEEGSGLSRNNLATPEATVALLAFMSRHKAAETYLAALPIAGVDGTLRNRMKGTRAAGDVRAKTGSLRWADSLSGYVTTAAGERLAFCLMLNRSNGGSARLDLDAIAVKLAGLKDRVGS
ncbi:MAG TPA: D-alanyl-D-alanine carboxypeptidase/D-alanyl-D-alanine-endopeptidase [Verrucomicrobiae bacterium]|nr:D-alanyl-D-alanine carboxypeptidase/D-alanyl-D-alanine-endopeptidase [Verrucomicrobiae bacterium]